MVAGGALSALGLACVWIALAGRLDSQDLLGGACAAVLAAVIGYFVSQQGSALPSFRREDVRQIVALPKRVVVETSQVFAVVARKALGRPGEGGSWMQVPVGIGAGGWRAARRASVLTGLLSVAPGSIVVDVDTESGVALVHRLGGAPRSADSP